MAVIVEIDLKLEELMVKLDCEPDLISEATLHGLTATYQSNGILVKNHSIEQMAPIKLGVLQQVIQGKLPGGATKNIARTLLEKAVKKVLVESPKLTLSEPGDSVLYGVSIVSKAAKTHPIPKTDLESVFSVSPAQETAISTALDKAKIVLKKASEGGLSAVPLITAKDLYQPVKGSGTGSVYHVIALHPKVKIAVRISEENSVSIRAECHDAGTYGPALMAAGLSSSNSHYSIHLAAEDAEMARRAIGAVVYGVGCKFDQIATDLKPIWGKGV